ncbi:Golgi to ER traffic protein 4 homolog [Musca domestica]|uniref:Golgi to ER traffic protein 4 homolog n=1 Tax=Musca domestica TaxID=7370 RepID=A0A1I8NHG2_MUSDO|nr:Golgi to ER traffic protein 4 homolog [Musca domestica]
MMTASETATNAAPSERGQRGVSRVLAKLDSSIESGNYYEAHQMYRTLYFRYTAQQKFDECLELLYNGALKLISKQQETSGADLGLLLLDTLEKRGNSKKDGDLWVERIGNIITCLNAGCVERETLINRSIKWSAEVSGNYPGDPALYKILANVFWSEGNTELARRYYMLCRDGNLCGRILIKINETKGYKSEVDLFIVQAVLQQISLNDRKTAEDTFTAYTRYHPKISRKEAPFKQPLLNFIHFLFRLMDTKNLEAFKALCTLYKAELERDPAFEKYLTKIGVQHFGANPPVSESRFGGMFGDVISRLLQGIDEDDDDEGDTGRGVGERGQGDGAHALD